MACVRVCVCVDVRMRVSNQVPTDIGTFLFESIFSFGRNIIINLYYLFHTEI